MVLSWRRQQAINVHRTITASMARRRIAADGGMINIENNMSPRKRRARCASLGRIITPFIGMRGDICAVSNNQQHRRCVVKSMPSLHIYNISFCGSPSPWLQTGQPLLLSPAFGGHLQPLLMHLAHLHASFHIVNLSAGLVAWHLSSSYILLPFSLKISS